MGLRQRVRNFTEANGGAPCEEDIVDFETCDQGPCPGNSSCLVGCCFACMNIPHDCCCIFTYINICDVAVWSRRKIVFFESLLKDYMIYNSH